MRGDTAVLRWALCAVRRVARPGWAWQPSTRKLGRLLCAVLVLGGTFASGQDRGGVAAPAAAPVAAEAITPGRSTLKIQVGGWERTALVHVPSGYQASQKPPLVLALHGAGGSAAGMLDNDGWAAKADAEGFVVVAPEGLPAKPRDPANFFTNPQVWNAGQLRAGSPRSAIDDVAFIRQLLDVLRSRTPHDERRVFCTGHSNGGGMTFRLANELSDRIAAIGTVAGLMAVENPRPARPMPSLYILGTKDPLMPIAGGEVKLPWGKRQNPPVAQFLAAWAGGLGCQTTPETISDTEGVKKVVYRSKARGPELEVLYLEGHGHHWPGAKRTLPESITGPATSKLDATGELWRFFQTHGGAAK